MNIELKNKIRDKTLQSLNYSESVTDAELYDKIFEIINDFAKTSFMPLSVKEEMKNAVFYSIRGLDVLESLLSDENITEIMVNGPDNIFVEKKGKLFKTDLCFESEEKLLDIISHIASNVNRTVNESVPIADARLTDGSRSNIVLPPVAINGPALTIRKFSKKPLSMEDLCRMNALSTEAAEFIEKIVRAKYNIFVCGGTGSGKTTFLNAMAGFVPESERIITIEDSAELKLQNIKNLVSLEARNGASRECAEITIRDLIRTALRMRPDRIIVGEVRGAEVIDMLSAMSTGHDGSFSTGHGNSIPDMLDRLETMMLMGMDIPLSAVKKQISSAIDIMIHLGRLRDGTRKVLEITEVLGVRDGEIELNPLFRFKENEKTCDLGSTEDFVTGELVKTGNSLLCRGKLVRAGITVNGA